jgi:AcrR family transcriptional regulator
LNCSLITLVARPRKFTDDQLLAAAGVAISRLGPTFTLADVAAEARVSAGTLVQRFGSKHGMLVAMMSSVIESLRRDLVARVDNVEDPVDAIRQALVEWYGPLDDPTTAANNLAQLGVDLGDPELRELMGVFYAVMEGRLRPLIRRALAAGELPGAPSAPVAARILAATADGTALHWSARPSGSLRRRLRTDLDAVLAGWRRPPSTSTRRERS